MVADREKSKTAAPGLFGNQKQNPFSATSSQGKELINEDFLMTDFENLLKRKPQDIHKRPKLNGNQTAPVAHLNLSSKPYTSSLYDRFEDFEDPTYLIN